MKNIFEKIISRDLFLRELKIKEIFPENDQQCDFKYNLDVKYKIVQNKKGLINIKLDINSYFVPEMVLNAELRFNMLIEIDGETTVDEIKNNIESIIYPVGAEVSYLLSCITKSMNGGVLILPPTINKIEEDK